MRLIRTLFAGVLLMFATAIPTLAAEKAIIVLDASGSMWAQVDGVARITIARQTLADVLGSLPDGIELGLIAYGHREKGNCDDIELLVEPAAGTADAIISAADRLSPKGKTPLSAAVKLAAEDLNYTEDKATVILITDGLETCEADPCALGAALEGAGVDFTAHVVGFGLSDAEGQEVACLAENTGGKYFAAADATALTKALTTAVEQVSQPATTVEAPVAAAVEEPVSDITLDPEIVMAEGDDPLPDDFFIAWELSKSPSAADDAVQSEYYAGWQGVVAPGDYKLSARADYAVVSQPVTVVAGKTAEPYFVLNAGRLILHPKATADGDTDNDAAVSIVFANDETMTNYGDVNLVVPAGDTEVTVTLGSGEVIETIAVAAGETVERDIIVGTAYVLVNGYYVEGMKIEDGDLAVEILSAKAAIDGSRKNFDYGYGPDSDYDLAAGDYLARVTMEQASVDVPFTVKAGEQFTLDAILGAGVLYISAPGGDAFAYFGSKKDIQGKRKTFGYAYGEEAQMTLPAGDYIVEVTPTGGTEPVEVKATVIAGERTELSVDFTSEE